MEDRPPLQLKDWRRTEDIEFAYDMRIRDYELGLLGVPSDHDSDHLPSLSTYHRGCRCWLCNQYRRYHDHRTNERTYVIATIEVDAYEWWRDQGKPAGVLLRGGPANGKRVRVNRDTFLLSVSQGNKVHVYGISSPNEFKHVRTYTRNEEVSNETTSRDWRDI